MSAKKVTILPNRQPEHSDIDSDKSDSSKGLRIGLIVMASILGATVIVVLVYSFIQSFINDQESSPTRQETSRDSIEQIDLNFSGTGISSSELFSMPYNSYLIEYSYSKNLSDYNSGTNFISHIVCDGSLGTGSIVNDIEISGSGKSFFGAYNPYLTSTNHCYFQVVDAAETANWIFHIITLE